MKGKIRTVIIDDNAVVVENLKSYFDSTQRIDVVRSFDNGEDALAYLTECPDTYDLILMDVLLPRLDGTTLLENLKAKGINKKIIILSSYKDEKIIRKCADYNVSHYMLKPVNISALERRIYEAIDETNNYSVTSSRKGIDLEVSQLLHNLGIPTHIRGYKYIRDSVLIIYNNDHVESITKELYPQIARKYDTTSSRVERAIRHAIEVSCTRGDLALIEELFGFSISSDKARPTNAEFIITLADRFKVDKSFGKITQRA